MYKSTRGQVALVPVQQSTTHAAAPALAAPPAHQPFLTPADSYQEDDARTLDGETRPAQSAAELHFGDTLGSCDLDEHELKHGSTWNFDENCGGGGGGTPPTALPAHQPAGADNARSVKFAARDGNPSLSQSVTSVGYDEAYDHAAAETSISTPPDSQPASPQPKPLPQRPQQPNRAVVPTATSPTGSPSLSSSSSAAAAAAAPRPRLLGAQPQQNNSATAAAVSTTAGPASAPAASGAPASFATAAATASGAPAAPASPASPASPVAPSRPALGPNFVLEVYALDRAGRRLHSAARPVGAPPPLCRLRSGDLLKASGSGSSVLGPGTNVHTLDAELEARLLHLGRPLPCQIALCVVKQEMLARERERERERVVRWVWGVKGMV